MVWFVFVLLSAVTDATYYMLLKKFLKNINQYLLGSGVYLSTFVILLIFSIIRGFPETGKLFWLYLIVTVLLNLVATILMYKALKTTDLSLSLPMISFTPIFLILTSFIILRELPTAIGVVGIVLIVIGSYILHINKKSFGLLQPFREIVRNKGTLYMLIVALIFSVSSNFDKLIVLNSDTSFSTAMFSLFLGLLYLIISGAKKLDVKKTYKKNWARFLLIGIVIAATAILVNTAFTMQIVPYVLSIKRLGIFFGVIYGFLLFKEKHRLNRTVAALIMVAGAVLIILS